MTLKELLSKIEDGQRVQVIDYLDGETPLIHIPRCPTRKDELTLAQVGAYLNREVGRVQIAAEIKKKSYMRIRLELGGCRK